MPYKGSISNIPEKWALCNGSNGTPNLSGRFLEGVTSSPGSTKSAGLPNITGSLGTLGGAGTTAFSSLNDTAGSIGTGALRSERGAQYTRTSGAAKHYTRNISFDASRCSSIYGSSSTVQPKSYTVLFIMKIEA